MHDPFIAFDPGTYSTGISVYRDGAISHWGHVQAPKGTPAHERIALILAGITDYHREHAADVTAAACEKTTAMERSRPSPELATLIRSIRSWAKGTAARTKKKLLWVEYNPKTVAASVTLKGFPQENSKETINLGVNALYSNLLTAESAPMRPPLPQDVMDAIAVGHCHLSALITEQFYQRAF